MFRARAPILCQSGKKKRSGMETLLALIPASECRERESKCRVSHVALQEVLASEGPRKSVINGFGCG